MSAARVLHHIDGQALIAEVPSSSRPGHVHRLAIVGQHIVCTCEAGVRGRPCRHPDDLAAALRTKVRGLRVEASAP